MSVMSVYINTIDGSWCTTILKGCSCSQGEISTTTSCNSPLRIKEALEASVLNRLSAVTRSQLNLIGLIHIRWKQSAEFKRASCPPPHSHSLLCSSLLFTTPPLLLSSTPPLLLSSSPLSASSASQFKCYYQLSFIRRLSASQCKQLAALTKQMSRTFILWPSSGQRADKGRKT